MTAKKNRFVNGLVIRLIVLCGISAALMLFVTKPGYLVTCVLLLLLLVLNCIAIVYYVRQPQKRISGFVDSLLSGSDLPASPFPDDKEDEIAAIFNNITTTLREIKIEKQSEYELFTEIINRLSSAVLVLEPDGSILLNNKAALQLLRMPAIGSVNQISKRSKELAEALTKIHSGEKLLVKTTIDGIQVKLTLASSEVRFSDKTRHIITFNDIQEEVAKEEAEAWKRVIRIMAHEIINSTAPINMLANSMQAIVKKDNLTGDDLKDLSIGLEAIEKRSRGMTSFVDNYRTKATIPTPVIVQVSVEQLFNHIVLLYKDEINSGIVIETSFQANATVLADEKLLEQVLINLVRNAIDATDKQSAKIILKAESADDYVLLKVIDNGYGISEENMENIFTPFFTTKEKGTGIGLFISRNMVWSMQGVITVQSVKGVKTVFTIRLPAK